MEKLRVIEQCRAQVLPLCEKVAERISIELPHVRTNVFEGSVGAATTYQGHHFGVECLFPDALPSESDNVALVVDVGTMEGVFQISAGVCWGQGEHEGGVGAQLLPQHTPVSEAALAQVIEGLPRLGDVLVEAARRGRPRHDA